MDAGKVDKASNGMEINHPRYLGSAQLAKLLGHTPRYVRKLAQDRLIPSIQMPGRDIIYDIDRVRAALARFEVKEIGQASSKASG
jgi:hypothetical protein